MSRKTARSVVALAVALALVVVPVPPALAATITVTSTTDEIGSANGSCTLREAIQAANTDAAVDACTAGSGSDTISLPAGTYTLSIAGANENLNQTGDLDVTDADGLTIDGAGAKSTVIDGNDIDRVLDRVAGALTLQQLTITDGSPPANEPGGGIRAAVNLALTLSEVAVTANTVTNAGVQVRGAGIFSEGATTITSSTVSGNTGANRGGGIAFEGAPASTITNSTISNNSGDQGAGIAAVGMAGNLTLLNTTVAANTAAADGGGLFMASDARELRTKNTIVADNSATSGPDCFESQGSIVSEGNTLLESTADCAITAGTGDITGSDPALGALADNGGDTETHALATSSVAVDAGTNTGCPATDQRGTTRPLDGPDADITATCDIGAYELQVATFTLTAATAGAGSGTITSSPAGIDCGSDCTQSYNDGTSVTLTASPAAGSAFTGWSGACSGSGTCTVTMSEARSVTATFVPTFTLTAATAGAGSGTITSSPAGIDCGSDCTQSYNDGTSVTLTASPAAGSRFSGWSGACSGSGTCTVTMSEARLVIASFGIERSGGGRSRAECEDFKDNDGDGLVDFPDDPGCTSYNDDSEDSDAPAPSPPPSPSSSPTDGDGGGGDGGGDGGGGGGGGGGGPTPSPTSTPTPTTRAPRSISLAARHLRGHRLGFSGRVTSDEKGCVRNPTVRLQRRTLDDRWKTVQETKTDVEGRYQMTRGVRSKTKFRSRAPATQTCARALSSRVVARPRAR